MRRAFASLLLALFSFPLILPMLGADVATNLPACCRRNGVHHCRTAPENPNAGQSANALRPRCASYPSSQIVTGIHILAFADNSSVIGASQFRGSALAAQSEAHYRISFSRSRQKRGPPSLLS